MRLLALHLAKMLALTLVLEIIPLLFMQGRRRWILASILCNFLTNPMLNCANIVAVGYLGEAAGRAILIAMEILVIPAEAGIYRLVLDEKFPRCLKAAAICNVFSFSIGLILT